MPNDNEEINALVLDEVKGKLLEHLADDQIPAGSFTRLYHKQWVHLVKRDRDGNITLPDIKVAMADVPSPNDVYVALRCIEAPKLFCVSESPWISSSIKGLGVVFGVLVVFAFFVWAAGL